MYWWELTCCNFGEFLKMVSEIKFIISHHLNFYRGFTSFVSGHSTIFRFALLFLVISALKKKCILNTVLNFEIVLFVFYDQLIFKV